MPNIPFTYGSPVFNCTYSGGLRNCPIHSTTPAAGLTDCDSGRPMLFDTETHSLHIARDGELEELK